MKPTNRFLPIIVLVGVNAIWGFSFPLMKSLSLQIDAHYAVDEVSASYGLRIASAAWMIAFRFGLATICLAILFPRMFRRATKLEWKVGAAVGLFLFVGLLFQVVGLASIPASRSGFLTSLTTVFAPLFGWLVFRRRPSVGVAIGIVLALVGVAFLTGFLIFDSNGVAVAPNATDAWKIGDTLTTLAAMFFTGQILLIDHFGSKLDSSAVTPGMFATLFGLAGLVGLIAIPWVNEGDVQSHLALIAQPSFSGILVFLGGFCTLLSFVGMNKYQPYVTAAQASVIYTLEPVFASSWALILPSWISAISGVAYANETWDAPLWIGGGLILVANVVALWPGKKRERNQK